MARALVILALITQYLTVSARADENSLPPLIDPEVRGAVSRGNARVVVELRITGGFKAEGEIPNPVVEAQRNAIAAAQAGILSRLAGTRFSLVRQYKTIPFLVLEIGADALAVLETAGDLVAQVHKDTMMVPSRSQGVSLSRRGGAQ